MKKTYHKFDGAIVGNPLERATDHLALPIAVTPAVFCSLKTASGIRLIKQ